VPLTVQRQEVTQHTSFPRSSSSCETFASILSGRLASLRSTSQYLWRGHFVLSGRVLLWRGHFVLSSRVLLLSRETRLPPDISKRLRYRSLSFHHGNCTVRTEMRQSVGYGVRGMRCVIRRWSFTLFVFSRSHRGTELVIRCRSDSSLCLRDFVRHDFLSCLLLQ
jgi:hypothetical protein